MAPYQTSYTREPPIGVPGMVKSEEKCNKISREVETVAGIPFSHPVQRGTADHGVAILSSGQFVGLSVLNPAVPAGGVTDGYPQYFTGAFMTMGVMLVVAGDDVVQGEPVYWDSTTGRFTADPGDIEIPECVFDTSGGDGDLVEIALRLRAPGAQAST